MDPYIETPKLWTDFHNDLAAEIRASLNEKIQPHYFARLETFVTYETIEIGKKASIRPDVSVWQPSTARETAVAYETRTTAPIESQVSLDVPLELNRVEIYRAGGEWLVTVIEILSPVNKKRGHDAHTDYLRKRRDLLRSSAHFIEIDFLRGGERPPLETPVPVAPYYAMLSRADRRPHVQVWPIQLAHRLPVLPVPLYEPDPDASLDLAAMVAAVYERGGYASQIDYAQPAPPPELSEEEMKWVAALLKPRAHKDE